MHDFGMLRRTDTKNLGLGEKSISLLTPRLVIIKTDPRYWQLP